MFRRNLAKLIGSVLIGALIILGAGALTACANSTSEAKAPAATETPTPTREAPASSPEASIDNNDLLAQGKVIYQETAGGVGCALCHGREARGTGTAPDIRGVESIQIREAVKYGVPAMSFIELSQEEIESVGAYIQQLSAKPEEMN